MSRDRDFNNIRQWIEPQLEKRGWSVEKFARRCKFSRAIVYLYMKDVNRPTEESMAVMCKVLGRPYAEGLAQYTPRPNGRPVSSRSGAQAVSVRHKR